MDKFFILLAMLVCIAGGWIVGDWQRQRIATAEQTELRERAESLSTKLVDTERRLTAAEAGRSDSRQRGRSLVASSDLDDCIVDDALAGLLHANAQATRARADRGKAGADNLP